MIARRASTKQAPAIAPEAAAVTPSTNALTFGLALIRSKYGKRDHDEEVDGQEHAERGGRRPGRARHQVADERHRDDDRAGREHRHRHRVEELPLVQPAVLLHDPPVEERHDREPAAEHEGARPW